MKRKGNLIPFLVFEIVVKHPFIDCNLLTVYRTCVVLSSDDWYSVRGEVTGNECI